MSVKLEYTRGKKNIVTDFISRVIIDKKHFFMTY